MRLCCVVGAEMLISGHADQNILVVRIVVGDGVAAASLLFIASPCFFYNINGPLA